MEADSDAGAPSRRRLCHPMEPSERTGQPSPATSAGVPDTCRPGQGAEDERHTSSQHPAWLPFRALWGPLVAGAGASPRRRVVSLTWELRSAAAPTAVATVRTATP